MSRSFLCYDYRMKKIGILGGVGPQATAYIYQNIIQQSASSHGAVNNDDYPYVVFASVPVPDFISDKDNIDRAKEMLIEAAQGLVKSGCETLCIGSNTVHLLLDDVQAAVQVPFISMVELVAKECHTRGYKKVALLGTPVLIESGLYDKAMQEYGIDLMTPDNKQETICDSVIRRVIAGKPIDEIKPSYISVLNAMFDSGAEAVILGCTELPMVLNYEALGKRVISSDEVLARGIVEYYYSQT
jgi:aspartate racemase